MCNSFDINYCINTYSSCSYFLCYNKSFINREKRIVTLEIHPSTLVKRSELFALQKAIEDGNVGADKAIVNVRYTPEMFDLSYFGEIIEVLRAETPSYNGTLNDAELELSGENTLIVELAHGGAGLLEAMGFRDALRFDLPRIRTAI